MNEFPLGSVREIATFAYSILFPNGTPKMPGFAVEWGRNVSDSIFALGREIGARAEPLASTSLSLAFAALLLKFFHQEMRFCLEGGDPDTVGPPTTPPEVSVAVIIRRSLYSGVYYFFSSLSKPMGVVAIMEVCGAQKTPENCRILNLKVYPELRVSEL